MTVRQATLTEAQALIEIATRQNMALSLFRPMEHQEPFFRNWARQHVLRGGNRAGKSMCAAAMFAAVAMDVPILFNDGTSISMRRPWQKGRCLKMWIIGFDMRHIGETIHRLLFQAGAFKVIKDKNTNRYRAYCPWLPEDSTRGEDAKDAAPLIPRRYVKPKSFVWEVAKNKEFKKVVIIDPMTGEDLAEIYAYSSQGEPKAGDPVDFIWIDEKIYTATHYAEWRARLTDRKGCLIWSSWPATNNDALAALSEEAVKESLKPNPLVRETVITLSANKSLPDDVRNEALGMHTTEEERRARDKGEYVTDLLRMYPLYDEYVQQAILDGDPDDVSIILRKTDGMPPSDWTVDLVLDPGTSHPGVLFCAIPPYHIGRDRAKIVYDELSPDRHDAIQLAKLVAAKLGGRKINRFIIDWQAGRQKSMGHSVTNEENYRRAFSAAGIELDTGDLYFTRGSNNVGGRIGIVQEWLHIDPRGLTPLRIVRSRCPKLCEQLRKYKKSCVNNDVKDDRPAPGQVIDLAACYDSKTEVLTRGGWKLFSDVTELDSLGTVTLQSKLLEYQVPIALTQRHYSGEMVKVKGRRLDLLVTPRHRMVVQRQSGDDLCVVEARDLCKTHSIPLAPSGWVGHRPTIKMARQFNGRHQLDEIKDTVAFAEFLGWYLAEGCCVKYKKLGRGFQVVVSQRKAWGREKLEECLDKNPFHYTPDGDNYRISHKQLWHYLKDFGSKSYTKFVPQWVKDSDTEVIESFLRGYIFGDGHRNKSGSVEIVTTSPRMADDLQELFLKTGVPSTINVRQPVDTVMASGYVIHGRRPIYSIRAAFRCRSGLLYRKSKVDGSCEAIYSLEQYDGIVYCASVPNGTLVVRRNGRAAVCGNCLEYWAASNPQYVQPKYSEKQTDLAGGWNWFVQNIRKRPKAKQETVQLGPTYSQ